MATGTGIILLVGALAVAFFGLSVTRGLKMRDEKRHVAELLCYALALMPFAAVALIWAATEGLNMKSRIIIFIVGALIGGFGLAGAAEWLKPTTSSPSKPGAQSVPHPYAELEKAMTEALADPRYSAQTKEVIQRQRDVLPFKAEYRATHGNVSPTQMKTPEAVAFFNQRLRETGKRWQIAPDNVDSTFGNVMLDSSMSGPFTAGIKITGGGGNIFDQTDIHGAQTGIDLERTKDNQFSNTRISTPTERPK
jgi:hypothetical protein